MRRKPARIANRDDASPERPLRAREHGPVFGAETDGHLSASRCLARDPGAEHDVLCDDHHEAIAGRISSVGCTCMFPAPSPGRAGPIAGQAPPRWSAGGEAAGLVVGVALAQHPHPVVRPPRAGWRFRHLQEMIVHLIVEAGKAALVGARQSRHQGGGVADHPRPGDKHPFLAGGHAIVVSADKFRALGNEDVAARGGVIDVFADLAQDLARQIAETPPIMVAEQSCQLSAARRRRTAPRASAGSLVCEADWFVVAQEVALVAGAIEIAVLGLGTIQAAQTLGKIGEALGLRDRFGLFRWRSRRLWTCEAGIRVGEHGLQGCFLAKRPPPLQFLPVAFPGELPRLVLGFWRRDGLLGERRHGRARGSFSLG